MADIKRLNYFTYQFLVEKDFDDEQDYHLQMRRRHNRSMHTAGVAIGMEVTRTGTGNQVRIAAGTAVDRDGREIVLEDARTYALVTSGNDQDVFLTIAYREEFDQADHSTEGGVNEFKRTTERPQLQDSATAPPADGSVLLLARIRLNGQGQIDSDAAINAGVRTLATAKIAPKAITTAQLADGAVTLPKLAADARAPVTIVSGVVTFQNLLPNVEAFSNDINPGFGAGPVSVNLALDDVPAANSTLGGDTNFGRAIQHRTTVNRANGTFRIAALRAASSPAGLARIRWFAFKPVVGADSTVVVDVTINPPTASLAGNSPLNLTASASNVTNAGVTWSITPSGSGTLSAATASSVTYTSPVVSGTYQVVATSIADPSKSKSATVTVNAAITVQLSPLSANLLTGKPLSLTADVLNTADKGITWSITPAGGGTLSAASGLATTYTAPATPGTFTVKATSTADQTKSASCIVTVAAVTITVSADATTINVNTATTVRATISPAFADNRANWQLQVGSGGTLSTGQGTTTTYTAPSTNGTRTIIGTSVADPNKTHSVSISVVGEPPPPPPPPPPGGKEFLDIVGENVSLDDGKSGTATKPKTEGKARTFLRPQKRPSTKPPEEPEK